MEEKEEPVEGSGGGAVVEKEEKQTNTGSEGSRKSKASKGPNGNGENRESIGSAVSPSLNRLIVGDAEDGSSINLRYLQKPKDEPRDELGRRPRKTRRVSSKQRERKRRRIPKILIQMIRVTMSRPFYLRALIGLGKRMQNTLEN